MTREDLAWAAGLFEGEGCFSPRRPSGRKSMHLHAAVTSTDRDVIERFAQILEFGHINYSARKARPHHTPTYRWFVNGEEVERLYELLEPWLCGRRRARYAELLAERRHYETVNRATHRRIGTLTAQRSRDPNTGRFLPQRVPA